MKQKIKVIFQAKLSGLTSVNLAEFYGLVACQHVADGWAQPLHGSYDECQTWKAVCKRLDVGRGGLTAKNTSLLRQFDDKDNVAALIHLSERLLAEAQKNAKPTLRDALPVQTALCIELLLMMPMRISNLARLDLDRHIILPKRSGGPVHISIASGEVKNDVGIEAELPAPTVRLLLIYLKTYRSLLLRAPSSWLFPGEAASHKSLTGLAVQIKETIARKTGLRVNAHLFRHIAAKLYLTQNPGAYGVIRLVHGHKSVETTTRHYCGTETAAAMRHFDENVLQLRKIYRPKLRKGRSQLKDKVKRPTDIPKDPVTKPPKGSR